MEDNNAPLLVRLILYFVNTIITFALLALFYSPTTNFFVKHFFEQAPRPSLGNHIFSGFLFLGIYIFIRANYKITVLLSNAILSNLDIKSYRMRFVHIIFSTVILCYSVYWILNDDVESSNNNSPNLGLVSILIPVLGVALLGEYRYYQKIRNIKLKQ